MWLQTGDYNLEGLYWLIGIAVTFVIAVVALVVAIWLVARVKRLVVTAEHLRMAQEEAAGAGQTAVAVDEPRTPEALRLLDGRYANGEITRAEYLQYERDLMTTSRRAAAGFSEPQASAQVAQGDTSQPVPRASVPTVGTTSQSPSDDAQSTQRLSKPPQSSTARSSAPQSPPQQRATSQPTAPRHTTQADPSAAEGASREQRRWEV